MINPLAPDYQNTPASDQRPARAYAAAETRDPLVSIVTPYFNTGPVFWETFQCIQRMSLPYWEWLIVDDGSSNADSLDQLRKAEALEPRIRILRQPNGGPAVARNRAAREARGRYLLLLDSDDMVEPTFLEKAVWLLETQPAGFVAANSWNVTFGAKSFLWAHGFDHGVENVRENFVTLQSVVRADAYRAVGGFDERVSYEHADWDFWLSLADKGLWGYTLPEYLTWYRTQARSLVTEIEGDHARAERFRRWLAKKHDGLERHFPRPEPMAAGTLPPPERHMSAPFSSPLSKPDGVRRVLLIAPWLQVGGADRFNLDMIDQLADMGYEFTVVTTLRDKNPWLSEFTRLTPDVFALHTFLNLADHPRFISYLIESRQIDAVVVSNSEFGYALLPYLRARHPGVALLDYNHSEEETAPLGGYPGSSVAAGSTLDLRMTATEHLREWMVARGADPDTIETRRCAIDLDAWRPGGEDRAELRARLGLDPDLLTLLFVGRMSHEKRPLIFAAIVKRLLESGRAVQAVAIGDGPDLPALKRLARRPALRGRLHPLGLREAKAIREVMAASDVLVMPSEREGLALVLMEGMAMGLTPVVAEVGGQAELAKADVGYLVKPEPVDVNANVNAYVEAVADILANPERRRSEWAARARERVAQAHDLRQLATHLDASFQRAYAIIAARSRAGAVNHAQPADAAQNAIRLFAASDRIAAEWERGEAVIWIRYARRARQRILPQGTSGYEAYKRVRVFIRQARAGRLCADVDGVYER